MFLVYSISTCSWFMVFLYIFGLQYDSLQHIHLNISNGIINGK